MTGNELRQRREQMMLTQVELAQRLGVAANTVARWERDERTPSAPRMLRVMLESIEANLTADQEWQAERNRRARARMERSVTASEAAALNNPPEADSAIARWASHTWHEGETDDWPPKKNNPPTGPPFVGAFLLPAKLAGLDNPTSQAYHADTKARGQRYERRPLR
jgi:transcriptional regulator with XRE-family HTH domain